MTKIPVHLYDKIVDSIFIHNIYFSLELIFKLKNCGIHVIGINEVDDGTYVSISETIASDLISPLRGVEFSFSAA